MSVRLTLILSGKPYEEREFKVFKRLRIGRSEDCEVRIDNLGISRFQCEIVNLGGSYQVRNLSRSQPTFVNGSQVESCTLTDGDGISFGKFTVGFACDAAWGTVVGAPSAGKGFGEKTMDVDPEAEAKARRESLNKVRGYLALGGEDNRQLERCFFTIGKDPDADLILDGWTTPRLAAIVIREEAGFRIIDLSPKADSVKINGKARGNRKLSDDDEIDIRGRKLSFHSGAPT